MQVLDVPPQGSPKLSLLQLMETEENGASMLAVATPVEKVPAGQVAQELDAAAAWKLPAGHDVQAAAEAEE